MKKISLLLFMVLLAFTLNASQEMRDYSHGSGDYLEQIISVVTQEWNLLAFFLCINFTVVGRGIRIAEPDYTSIRFIKIALIWNAIITFIYSCSAFGNEDWRMRIVGYITMFIVFRIVAMFGGNLFTYLAQIGNAKTQTE